MTRFAQRLLVTSLALLTISCGGDDDAYTDAAPGWIEHEAGQTYLTPDSDITDSAHDVIKPLTDGSFNVWPASVGPITYHGGPVMVEPVNVYFIWYGDWTESTTPVILEDLIKNYNNTSYSAINTDYYQDAGGDGEAGSRAYTSGQVHFVNSIYVGYSRGDVLYESLTGKVVVDALTTNTLPNDPNGIYFVMSSADVGESMGWFSFCSDYCGYHEKFLLGGNTIKYSFIGDPTQCVEACTIKQDFAAAGYEKSPNDSWGADGMASVMIHELSETLTDPEPESNAAWKSASGEENGDMCAWRFDPTYPTPNGSRANVKFGTRDYVVQQMWVNDADGGHCDFHR